MRTGPRLLPRLLPLSLVLGLIAASAPERPAWAQVSSSGDAIEEIRSLSVRADVLGDQRDGGQLARLLEDVILQELRRADILFEVGDPRQGDCCVLRLDVRLATGAGRSRFGIGYTARLELAHPDRLGTLPTWTLVWTGRMLANIVERQDLTEALRFAARELAGDFVDLYRERFPIR
jgi:hypothetical protein